VAARIHRRHGGKRVGNGVKPSLLGCRSSSKLCIPWGVRSGVGGKRPVSLTKPANTHPTNPPCTKTTQPQHRHQTRGGRKNQKNTHQKKKPPQKTFSIRPYSNFHQSTRSPGHISLLVYFPSASKNRVGPGVWRCVDETSSDFALPEVPLAREPSGSGSFGGRHVQLEALKRIKRLGFARGRLFAKRQAQLP